MMKNKTFFEDFGKGFAINLIYEGGYAIYKIWAFCVLLFFVQFTLAVNSMNDFVRGEDVYISLYAVFENSIMPYVFVVALVFAMVVMPFYIIHKDLRSTKAYYAIRTLPFPKSCNLLAKYFYCVFSVLSVYLTQFLVFMVVLNYPDDYQQFRKNEWILSTTEAGILKVFFAPNTSFFPTLCVVIFCMTLIFIACIEFSHKVNPISQKLVFVSIGISSAMLMSHYYQNNLEQTTVTDFLVGGFVLICTFASFVLSYKKY